MARTYLTSDVYFYIASTGNDSTGDGSSGNPWATITKVYSYAQKNLDLAGQWSVYCYLQDTYTHDDSLSGLLQGQVSPSNFLIRGTGADQNRLVTGCLFLQNGAQARIQYIQTQPTSGFSIIIVDGILEFANININTANNGPMFDAAGPKALIRMVGPCNLVGTGGCKYVFIAEDHAQIELGNAFTAIGAPTWYNAFCQADLGGMIDASNMTYTGGFPTGMRYIASSFGIVFTGLIPGHPSAPTFFPGNSAGNSTGGFYQ